MGKDLDERREQLLDAALRVFSRKGFGKATIKDIAQEAKITPGLIYYYFASKEVLLNALLERYDPVQLIMPLTEAALDLSPSVFLRTLFMQMMTQAEEEPFISLLRVLLSELLHSETPYVSRIVSTVIARALDFLSGYLDVKMTRGELRQADSRFAAQLLMGELISFFLRRQVLRDPVALQYSREQIVNGIVDQFLQSFIPG